MYKCVCPPNRSCLRLPTEEDDWLSLSPPGRSVSLPALSDAAGCSLGAAAELCPEPWGGPAQLERPGRRPALFYLQESP